MIWLTKNLNIVKWEKEEINYLLNNYPCGEKNDIIKYLNRSWNGIRTKAKELKIKRINRSRYWINHNFFSVPFSPENMWVAGFIAADGCIRSNSNNIKIELSYEDIDVLEKIKKLTSYTGPIKSNVKNGKNYVVLSFFV